MCRKRAISKDVILFFNEACISVLNHSREQSTCIGIKRSVSYPSYKVFVCHEEWKVKKDLIFSNSNK